MPVYNGDIIVSDASFAILAQCATTLIIVRVPRVARYERDLDAKQKWIELRNATHGDRRYSKEGG